MRRTSGGLSGRYVFEAIGTLTKSETLGLNPARRHVREVTIVPRYLARDGECGEDEHGMVRMTPSIPGTMLMLVTAAR